jgi:hypothetical protein
MSRTLTQRELMTKTERLASRRGVSVQELIWELVEDAILTEERERGSDDAFFDLLFRDFSRAKLDRTPPGKRQRLLRSLGRRLATLFSTFRRGT